MQKCLQNIRIGAWKPRQAEDEVKGGIQMRECKLDCTRRQVLCFAAETKRREIALHCTVFTAASGQGQDKSESKIASITAVVEHIGKDSSPDEWQQNHGIRNKACIRNLMPLLASTSERVARRHTQS